MKKQVILIVFLWVNISFAQKKIPDNWQTLDPIADKVYGVGAEQAYKTLKDKKPKTVIVAVIDSGIDPNHEDLKDNIWTNPREIPDNGIDDDKNGYVDDIHGWNFIGGKNGEINCESTELARMYHKMSKKFDNADTNKLSRDDIKEYNSYALIKKEFLNEQARNEQELASVELISKYLEKVKAKNNGVVNKSGLKKDTPENEIEKKMKKRLKLVFTFGLKPEELESQVSQAKDELGNNVKFNEMNSDSIRQYVVGDDINNVNERYYGNNHIQGPDALHGTHVTGIIAAVRSNNKGIKGIAANVKIMIIRAVPNGDERDKDIANSIYYAVDNGASIINMSFGKYYSPDKKVIDAAVKYAASKDVLIIHASGNESKNSDVDICFPNNELTSGETATNWINVGASAYSSGKDMLGSFSNYGAKKVDLFAPGVNIYSTIPDNKYITESGTSMAAPSTTGVAALIRSYFPELKAAEVKEVMMKTVVPYKKKVKVPGARKETKKMTDLCVSGGFVNANNAVKELMGLNKKK